MKHFVLIHTLCASNHGSCAATAAPMSADRRAIDTKGKDF